MSCFSGTPCKGNKPSSAGSDSATPPVRPVMGDKPNANNESLLQIFALKKEGKKWKEMPFQLNNDKFNVADLVIAPDGSKVVFVSDMPGGYGKSDLYEAPVISNGPDGVKIASL